MTDTSREERERALHNTFYSEQTRARVWGFYDVTAASERCFRELLDAQQPRGKRVLEYGCGLTTQAFRLAQQGAEVTGIDVSEVAIDQARRRAAELGVGDRCTFRVMNAESLSFADSSFDIVCGSAVLHHLDLTRGYAELARVLAPDGTAAFVEPLGHNPLINLYRRRTPDLRTPDEHPLLMDDLAQASGHFASVEPRYFHLLSLLAIPLRGRKRFGWVLDALDAADRRLFARVAGARRYAWIAVLQMRGPR